MVFFILFIFDRIFCKQTMKILIRHCIIHCSPLSHKKDARVSSELKSVYTSYKSERKNSFHLQSRTIVIPQNYFPIDFNAFICLQESLYCVI